MRNTNSRHERLEKVYKSVPLTPEMKTALKKHLKEHLNVKDAAEALGISRRETLVYVIKNSSCSSATYNKLLVLVNPALAQNTPA